MIREDNTLCINGQLLTRSPKRKDLIKHELEDIFNAKMKLKWATDEKEIKELNHKIDRARKNIEELKESEIPHKHKYSTKPYKHEVLKKLILEAIKNEKYDSVCVENYAIRFKAKQGQVFTVFQELVKEGILSGKVRYYAHDTNRNPMFYGGASGWASNLYYIKENKKEENIEEDEELDR
jgi:hypothetical protein